MSNGKWYKEININNISGMLKILKHEKEIEQ